MLFYKKMEELKSKFLSVLSKSNTKQDNTNSEND